MYQILYHLSCSDSVQKLTNCLLQNRNWKPSGTLFLQHVDLKCYGWLFWLYPSGCSTSGELQTRRLHWLDDCTYWKDTLRLSCPLAGNRQCSAKWVRGRAHLHDGACNHRDKRVPAGQAKGEKAKTWVQYTTAMIEPLHISVILWAYESKIMYKICFCKHKDILQWSFCWKSHSQEPWTNLHTRGPICSSSSVLSFLISPISFSVRSSSSSWEIIRNCHKQRM